MVNEEILTALRNAIDHGENMDSACQILINSGYNEKEVQEASQFVPNTFSKLTTKISETQLTTQDKQPQQMQYQNYQQNSQISEQIKKSYTKEIILVITLIILIGILAVTIFFRDKVLEFISNNLLKSF